MIGLPFCISIRPLHIQGQGICGVRIQNRHSFASTFTISGQAEDKYIQFEAMPGKVSIPLGQKGALCVRVKRKRPFLGSRRNIHFTIDVKSSDGIQQSIPGTLECIPIVAVWQLALLLLFVIGFLLI